MQNNSLSEPFCSNFVLHCFIQADSEQKRKSGMLHKTTVVESMTGIMCPASRKRPVQLDHLISHADSRVPT